jgi:hypothetical protein
MAGKATYARSSRECEDIREQSRLLQRTFRQVVPPVRTCNNSGINAVEQKRDDSTYLNSHASSPQTPLSKLNASTGTWTKLPFGTLTLLFPSSMVPSRFLTGYIVGTSSSCVATRMDECKGGMSRKDSRETLCRYGRFDSVVYRDWISSVVKLDMPGEEEGAMERSSARKRDWTAEFCARRRRVHVRERDEVSDPANMNVLML